MKNESSPSPLWDNLFRPKPSGTDRIAELWSATPLFRGIPAREISHLASHMHPRRYAPGETVFRAGDLGVGAALILSGEVAIRLGNATIAKLGTGDFFGEVALVEEEHRTADAVAVGDVELVFFLRIDLEEWLDRKPRLGARMVINLAGVLAERLRYANRTLTSPRESVSVVNASSGAGSAT